MGQFSGRCLLVFAVFGGLGFFVGIFSSTLSTTKLSKEDWLAIVESGEEFKDMGGGCRPVYLVRTDHKLYSSRLHDHVTPFQHTCW